MICYQCKKDKPNTEFSFRDRKKNIRRETCADCINTKRKKEYATNPAANSQMRDWAKSRQQRLRCANVLAVFNYFDSHPCVDCTNSNPLVLEFDHVRGKKLYTVKEILTAYRFDHPKVQAEIAKCDVRCANCHAIKTCERLNGPKYKLYLERQME